MALERPRALLVSGDPQARETHLLGVLSAAGFEVQRTTGSLHPELEDFDLVIANNFHLEGWPEGRKERAAEFIRNGGGFLVIAGENSLYLETKRTTGTRFATRFQPSWRRPARRKVPRLS